LGEYTKPAAEIDNAVLKLDFEPPSNAADCGQAAVAKTTASSAAAERDVSGNRRPKNFRSLSLLGSPGGPSTPSV